MPLLGLDFDNTLVCYDKLFHRIAVEKGYINNNFKSSKIEIRNYLRQQGKDEDFTFLQGEVYGSRILEAEPSRGMINALRFIHSTGIKMVLISHKSKKPYKGPSYDLHQAAWKWLEKNKFFAFEGLGWNRSNIYFEETKEQKIKRIVELGCTHYIDDLTEILDLLPNTINKLHYSPEKIDDNEKHKQLDSWENMRIIKDYLRL